MASSTSARRVRSMTIARRRMRGYTINLYRGGRQGFRLVRDGRYRLVSSARSPSSGTPRNG